MSPFSVFEALAYRLAICLVTALRSAIESPTSPPLPSPGPWGRSGHLRGHVLVRQRTLFEDISRDSTRQLDAVSPVPVAFNGRMRGSHADTRRCHLAHRWSRGLDRWSVRFGAARLPLRRL